jgi:selenide,water dikinase
MLPTIAQARAWTDRGIEVTLVDPQRWLYYSGMVPEYLGGVYDLDEIRIDLERLAREAGISFVREQAAALDPEARLVTTAAGTEHSYDVLAVDVGAVNPAVPDAAVATKPIFRIRELEPAIREALASPSGTLRLVVVGGGAAGVEVALNVTGRFRAAGRADDLTLTIVEQKNQLLPRFPAGMQDYVASRLRERGASLRLGATVEAVEQRGAGAHVRMQSAGHDAGAVRAGAVLWATGTVGPAFLRESGLPTDDRGFLRVTDSLRVPTHPRIFAAGDCATLLERPLPKVGVHAVKQGPDLRANLDRTLRHLSTGAPPPAPSLTSFRPYPVAPLVLSTGTREGLWTAGSVWAAHPWLLRLKHWIDRRWIRRYVPEHWGDAGWRRLLGPEAACPQA